MKEWSECTIKERIDIKVNALVSKKALLHAHTYNTFFHGRFPLDDFLIGR
jgi:hypothetical protein